MKDNFWMSEVAACKLFKERPLTKTDFEERIRSEHVSVRH